MRLRRAKRLLDDIGGRESRFPDDWKVGFYEVRNTIREMLREPMAAPVVEQVNWSVYNRCPVICKGCYHHFHSSILSLAENKAIIDKLVSAGTREVVISGGDPMLWPEIIPFIEYAHSKGLRLAVDTAGYNITPEIARSLAGRVTYVGIPVDGSNQTVMQLFRRGKDDLFDRVRASIKILNDTGVKVKINTVAHKDNLEDLQNIARIVSAIPEGRLWGWSVFQWWDLRAPKALASEMAPDPKAYETVTRQLTEKLPTLPLRIGSTEGRARSYFSISETGEVFTFGSSYETGTIIMGNIKDQPMRDIVASPAFRKSDNPKLKSWFPPVQER